MIVNPSGASGVAFEPGFCGATAVSEELFCEMGWLLLALSESMVFSVGLDAASRNAFSSGTERDKPTSSRR